MNKSWWFMLAAGFVALSVGRELMRSPGERVAEVDVPKVAQTTYDELSRGAKEHHPELPSGQAMAREANDRASQKLQASSPQARTRIAAAQFLGFYISNTEDIPDICRSEGVDLTPYVAFFKSDHALLFEKATGSLRSEGLDFATFQEMMRKGQPQTRPVLIDSLKELAANTGKSSIREGCLVVATRSREIATAQRISHVNPDVYRVLTSL
jgi:hypothetical protein